MNGWLLRPAPSGVCSNNVRRAPAHLPTPHLRRLSGYQSWSLLPAHTTVALALLPVNCPDLRYPRSGIIMAFLAHLHTCTRIAWINSREVDDQGHPTRFDTSHPGPLMRPRIMEPRDTESNSCALLGSDKRERGTSGQRTRPEQSLVVGCSAATARGMM